MKKIRFELLPAAIAAVAAVPAFGQGQIGPLNTVQCSQVAISAVGTARVVSLLTGVAGKFIFICGWSMTSTSTTAGNFQLQYGTGTTCSANNAALTSALNVTSTAPATDHTQYATMQVPNNSSAGANPDLCVNVSTGVGGVVYVGQY